MSTLNGKNKGKFKFFLKNLGGRGFGRSTNFAEPKPNRILRPKQSKSFGRTEASFVHCLVFVLIGYIFRTLELKLIGPSLVGCGVFFALLRVLFCTVPSCCRACCKCCKKQEDTEELIYATVSTVEPRFTGDVGQHIFVP